MDPVPLTGLSPLASVGEDIPCARVGWYLGRGELPVLRGEEEGAEGEAM